MRFYLLFMLFTGASASLHHAILHRFGLAQSQIPRFILETKHSYLRENSISLEKLSNASEALCNPDSSLRRLIPPVPGDLFKQLTINSKTIGGEQGWDCSREVFTGIASCPAALAGVEELHIDFDPPDSVPPPPDVLDLFVRVLEAPQLKTLSWIRPSASDISNSFLSAFEHHFAHHGLLLPRVRRLTMGPNVHFLVSLAPHVESLATCDGHVWPYPWSWTMPRLLRDPDGPQFNLANATRAARELREFALEGTWVESLVTTLRDAAPGLEKLHMKGQISDKELDVIDYKRAGERLKVRAASRNARGLTNAVSSYSSCRF
jgi:hypothetical protein